MQMLLLHGQELVVVVEAGLELQVELHRLHQPVQDQEVMAYFQFLGQGKLGLYNPCLEVPIQV
jgi:hypothetical protein